MGVDTEYDDEQISQHAEGRNNQSIIIDTGKHIVLVALCSALCGLSVGISVWSAYQSTLAAKESRLTQYYLLDPHSRTPEELSAWAEFNRKYEQRIKE
jgi:hypothetical protein